MARMALASILVGAIAACSLRADEKDLTKLTMPGEQKAAAKVLKGWLELRGFECKLEKTERGVIFKRVGAGLVNIHPHISSKGELSRLRVTSVFPPKDEFKGKKEMVELAEKLNRSNNFLQVWIDDRGGLSAGSNLTFVDVLTAREFDAFMNLYVVVLDERVFTKEARKLLK